MGTFSACDTPRSVLSADPLCKLLDFSRRFLFFFQTTTSAYLFFFFASIDLTSSSHPPSGPSLSKSSPLSPRIYQTARSDSGFAERRAHRSLRPFSDHAFSPALRHSGHQHRGGHRHRAGYQHNAGHQHRADRQHHPLRHHGDRHPTPRR